MEILRSRLHFGPPPPPPTHLPKTQIFSAAFVAPVCPTAISPLWRSVSAEEGAARAPAKKRGVVRMIEKRMVRELGVGWKGRAIQVNGSME